MLFLITDGVGLTQALAQDSAPTADASGLLGKFFHAHFDHCLPNDWCRLLKTTGDGLIIVAGPRSADQAESWVQSRSEVAHALLAGVVSLSAALAELRPTPLKLRAILHANDPRFSCYYGSAFCSDSACRDSRKVEHQVFENDIFGLDMILAFRLLSLISGAYCVVSKAFLYDLLELTASDSVGEQEIDYLRKKVQSLNSTRKDAILWPDPVPFPHLKGLTNKDLSRIGVSFAQPYLGWEVRIPESGSSV